MKWVVILVVFVLLSSFSLASSHGECDNFASVCQIVDCSHECATEITCPSGSTACVVQSIGVDCNSMLCLDIGCNTDAECTGSEICNVYGECVPEDPTGSLTFINPVCVLSDTSQTCTGTIAWSASGVESVTLTNSIGTTIVGNQPVAGSFDYSWARHPSNPDVPTVILIGNTGATQVIMDSDTFEGECPVSHPYYESSSRLCVECTGDGDCSSGEYCDAGSCVDPSGSIWVSGTCEIAAGSRTCSADISWSATDVQSTMVTPEGDGIFSTGGALSGTQTWGYFRHPSDPISSGLALSGLISDPMQNHWDLLAVLPQPEAQCESGASWDSFSNSCVAESRSIDVSIVSPTTLGPGDSTIITVSSSHEFDFCTAKGSVQDCSNPQPVGAGPWVVSHAEYMDLGGPGTYYTQGEHTGDSSVNDYVFVVVEDCPSGYFWDGGSCVAEFLDLTIGSNTVLSPDESVVIDAVASDDFVSCTYPTSSGVGVCGWSTFSSPWSWTMNHVDWQPNQQWTTQARLVSNSSIRDTVSFETVECEASSDCSLNEECTGSNTCRQCVEITGISVSDSTPLEGSSIELRCSASPSGHSNVIGSISGGGSCSFSQWSGNDAVFDCSVGSEGSKTLTCGVQNRCQIGSDMTTTISVQSSECSSYVDSSSCSSAPASCEWCSGGSCSGNQYSSTAGSCVPSGSCDSYSCEIGQCGATCDSTGPNPSCVDDLGYDGGQNPADCDTGYSGASCRPLTGSCYNECGGALPSGSYLTSTDRIYGEVASYTDDWRYVASLSSPQVACEFTCDDPTPVYDSGTNSCVGCLGDTDCTGAQACDLSSNTCEDVEVSLSVINEDTNDPVSDGETITSCVNPEISASCTITPSGIGHTLAIDPTCSGDGSSGTPWSCSDGSYDVTCDANGYDSLNSSSFTLNSPTATISGVVRDTNNNSVSGIEWTATLYKKGVEVNSSTESDSDYSFVVDGVGEYVVTVTAENFDLTSQSVNVVCGVDATLDLTLSPLSCGADCTSGYGLCNYDCVGDGCELENLASYAYDLSNEGPDIIESELEGLLMERCSGAKPGDLRAIPGYPGYSFVCCGGSGGPDPVQNFGVVPATVESDARHLVSFTKIVNYGGLPVKMNVFVKSE